MYEQVFKLDSRPFTSTPYVKHYYAARAISDARDLCRMIVERAAGPVVVVGDHGTGKTLLLAMLEEQYKAQFDVVNLSCSMLQSKSDLLRSVLFETQCDYRGMNESEMRLSLIEYLKTDQAGSAGLLLLLDDAQKLTRETIEELQLLSSLVRDGQPRVRLILAGSRGLEDRLADPGLESFNQRIAGRSLLECLDREEVRAYVEAHIRNAGGSPAEIFDPAAFRAISDVSEGRPRLINQVCDHAMIFAATRGVAPITDSFIREVWMDVQKMPCGLGSVTSEATESTSSSVMSVDESDGWTVLEFGELDAETPTEKKAESFEPVQSLSEHEPEHEQAATATETFVNEAVVEEMPNQVQDGIRSEPEAESGSLDDASTESFCETLNVEAQQDIEPSSNDQSFTPAEVFEAQQPQIEVTGEESATEDRVSVDPFASDEFEDEEVLTDTYSPFVAQQNQRSLAVTTEHLRDLMPEDMATEQQHTPAAVEVVGQEETHRSVEDSSDQTEESFPTFETAMEPPTPVREPIEPQYEQREELETRYEMESLGPDSTTEEFIVRNDLSVMTETVHSSTEFESAHVELTPIADTSDTYSPAPGSNFVPLDPDATLLVGGVEVDVTGQCTEESPAETSLGSAEVHDDSVNQPVQSDSLQATDSETKYHEQAEAPDDADISRMAADIIKSLHTEEDPTTSVSHETMKSEIEQETAAIATTIQASIPPQTESDAGSNPSPAVVLPGTQSQNAEPVELASNTQLPQQMHYETAMKTDSNSQQPSGGEPEAADHPPALTITAREQSIAQESAILDQIQDTVSMLETATDDAQSQAEPYDDRDILNVSQSIDDVAQPSPTPPSDAELPSWSQSEPSRGEANRVDYQQLFNQLRNINPED